LRYMKREKVAVILNNIKGRLYRIEQLGDKVWSYPKLNILYILSLLDMLNDRNFFMDIEIPIIYDLYKYPIHCSDTHLKPMSDSEHDKNKDDYDYTQYVFERD